MRVCQVIADISGQCHLVLQAEPFLAVLAALLQVHPCLGADVGQPVLTLVSLDIGVHASQFLFNYDQAVIDEIGSIHRHLVLVVYRIFIIDGDQHIQHILCPWDRNILQGQVDDRCRFTGQCDLEGIAVTQSDIHPVLFHNGHRLAEIFIRII